MKVYDCGDFYFFGRHQKYQVEEVLKDELGLLITAAEITWEEYERQVALADTGERMNDVSTSMVRTRSNRESKGIAKLL